MSRKSSRSRPGPRCPKSWCHAGSPFLLDLVDQGELLFADRRGLGGLGGVDHLLRIGRTPAPGNPPNPSSSKGCRDSARRCWPACISPSADRQPLGVVASFDHGSSVMMRQIGLYWPDAKNWPHSVSSSSGLRPYDIAGGFGLAPSCSGLFEKRRGLVEFDRVERRQRVREIGVDHAAPRRQLARFARAGPSKPAVRSRRWREPRAIDRPAAAAASCPPDVRHRSGWLRARPRQSRRRNPAVSGSRNAQIRSAPEPRRARAKVRVYCGHCRSIR